LTSEVIDCDSTADLVLLASKEGLLFNALLAIGTSAGCDDKEDAMDRRGVLKAAAFVVVSAGLSPMSSRVSAAERVSERRSPMSNANEAVVRLLKTWSERDAKRRRELVAQTFTEDGIYIDRVREGRGHDGIDAMIAKVQAQNPGYSVYLASGIDAHHDCVRFSWVSGGTAEAPLYYKGTDFAVIADDGRLKSVIGFTDATAAPVTQP
jgi:SnoaL-like domain